MTDRIPATLTHPAWVRAISAHMTGAVHAQVPAHGLPRLESKLLRRRFPVAHFDSWLTPLTNSGLPTAAMTPTVDDALAMLEATECPILFRNLPIDHPVTGALLQAAAHVQIVKRWERAGLNLQGTYENWLQTNFDQKRRKELKRLRARLSEQGHLETRVLTKLDDVTPFFEAFLQLEQDSWKGKRGTAIASVPGAAKALEAGLIVMHAMGRLKFWQLTLDNKPLASLFAIIDDGEAGLGKIAHADSHAKYSPGVLVIMDATEDLLASEGLFRADSNAIPDHPMINRIWRDRIECMDVLLAGPTTSTASFQLLAKFLGTKDALKSKVKRVLAQTLGRKLS
jgi:CelD/BcsL family acetyltransferase involved in cellulose biosynthesis